MTPDPDTLADRLLAGLDGAFGEGAGLLSTRLFDILSAQAPVAAATAPSGRVYIYATEPAEPGAPPRRVTGRLQAHVGLEREGVCRWAVGVRRGPYYAAMLEFQMGHPFFQIVVDSSLDDIGALLRRRTGG